MTLSIAHNMMAMNANRKNRIQVQKKEKAVEKLSSGYRINRAADDVAGLSISEKMRSQIRALNRASDNIQDGISYVQTADGALAEVQDMLQRIRELSIQSANDTNTVADRYAINEEIQQIKVEMGRVFQDTEFNNQKIWSDKVQMREIIVGTKKAPAVTMPIKSQSSIITNNNKEAVPKTSYSLKADDSGIIVSWTGYNGKQYESNTIPYDADISGTHTFKLSDHMDYTVYPEAAGIDFTYAYNVREEATFDDMVNSLNGRYVSSSENSTEWVKQFSSGNTGTSFSVDINYPALLVSEKDFEASDDDFIKGTSTNITNNPLDSGKSAEKWEFTFDMKNIGTVKATSSSTYYRGTTSEPDNGKWWYWVKPTNGTPYKSTYTKHPEPSDGSLDSVLNALKTDKGYSLQTDAQYGGRIYVNFSLIAENAYTCPDGTSTKYVGSMTMYVNVGANDTPDTIRNKLANLNGIDIYDDASKTTTGAKNYTSQGPVSVDILDIGYEYDYRHNLHIQSGANAGDAILISYDGLSVGALGLEEKNVTTAENANEMIGVVDHAVSIISRQRSIFGAYQNRLEYAKAAAENTAENTQAAESRIRDEDMAKGIAEYFRRQVLSQAGQSMMAQANQTPQMVLKLLK
ncbi:MAG: flagellin [Roseburia sp.]